MSGFTFMLCADDYALSPGVSTGILEALSAGRLTATSVMTNMPRWRSGAGELARLAPQPQSMLPQSTLPQIGLHLNLTLGAPLAPMPSFAPHGRFPELSRLIRSARNGALPEAEVRAEIARQLDAFEDAMGRPPDYVDGHQHVQVLPGIRGWLFEELARRGQNSQFWLRNSADSIARILARHSEMKKAMLLAILGRGFARDARACGFACNDGFAGFSRFDPKADYASDFARYLVVPGPRHLVMCHPGHADAELTALDPNTTTRENELAFLLSPQFETALAATGGRLGRWEH